MVNDYRAYMRAVDERLSELESKAFDREVSRQVGIDPADENYLEAEDQKEYDELTRKYELLLEWEAVHKQRGGRV